MPEGDAVWRTARELERLGSDPLTVCDLRFPDVATVDLIGARATSVSTYGKHLLHRFTLEGQEWTIHSHLRMEGRWRVHDAGGAGRTHHHTVRAVLSTAYRTAIGHELGMLDVVRSEQESRLIGHLGPDILAAEFNLGQALSRLRGQPQLPIVRALLDQTKVAGIGTIYACDPLFIHRINPFTPVAELSDAALSSLLDHTRRLVARNCTAPVPTLTGSTSRGTTTFVHGRANLPCRRCGTRIRGAMDGPAGKERWILWCPRCQGPAL